MLTWQKRSLESIYIISSHPFKSLFPSPPMPPHLLLQRALHSLFLSVASNICRFEH